MTDKHDIARLFEEWFQQELARAWEHHHSGDMIAALLEGVEDDDRADARRYYLDELAERNREDIHASLMRQRYDRGHPAATAILSGLDEPIAEHDQRFTVIAKEAMKAESAISWAQIEWANNNDSYRPPWKPELPLALFPLPTPANPSIAAPLPAPALTAMPAPAGKTLQQVFSLYARQRKLPMGTEKDFGTNIRRFVELHGDLDVAHITREHVRDFRDMLQCLPRRLPHDARRLTAPQTIKRYESDTLIPRLQTKTVNQKGLAALKATLGFAAHESLIPTNPAVEMEIKVSKRRSAPPRLPYNGADLQAIFGTPMFVKGVRSKGGAGEAAIWLPTIALFTGARLEELGALVVGDVLQEAGVHYLFIRLGKTSAARRKVPIHSRLLALGFLEYVAAIGTDMSKKLFPLVVSAKEQTTGSWGKWYGREARTVVLDPRKTFHSFRHTVKRDLRNAGCAKTLRDAVMGHESDDVAESYGLDEDGHGYALPELQKAIENLVFPDLKIVMAPAIPTKLPVPHRPRRGAKAVAQRLGRTGGS